MNIVMEDYPIRRMRRLRSSATLRDMLSAVKLDRNELVAPLFVREGSRIKKEIPSMPGQFQFSVDKALTEIKQLSDKGIRGVLLFGIPDKKDDIGSQAWNDGAAVQRLTAKIKSRFPGMVVITDACLCEYTAHGHCGTLRLPAGNVDNDQTLLSLAKVALSHARAGADIIAPSAMMDGQVITIRDALDSEGFENTAIMSYAVKFASSLYGPFRQAAESAPKHTDRKTYQMDYRTPAQVANEVKLDINEGADIIMVKPAAAYLDIISQVRRNFNVPLAAYHVSGEYAMIYAASERGWCDLKQTALEVTTAIKRAGADIIITYFAKQLAGWIE